MSALFTVARGETKWKKRIVAELEAELRGMHPVLFSGRLERLLEVRAGGISGAGTFVRSGRFVRKNRLLGAYFGEVGSAYGSYTLQHGTVRQPGRKPWIPMVDGRREAERRNVAQAALYNHSCTGANVYFKSFGSGRFRCKLAFAKKDLVGGTELVWHYGSFMVQPAQNAPQLLALSYVLTPCQCTQGQCPLGNVLLS